MENKTLKSIMQAALEKEIFPGQIELWPAVKNRLVARKHPLFRQGENMNTALFIRRTALATLALAVAVSLLAFTPQGRALAQNILQFFTRAESDVLPLQPWQIVPTQAAVEADNTSAPENFLRVVEAERMLGFDAKELPSTPRGLLLLGAQVYGEALSIQYDAEGGGGGLTLSQSLSGYPNQSEWDKVPADSITPVKVGVLDGEFVRGAFIAQPGNAAAAWNPDLPMLRLRWRDNDIWLEMMKTGNPQPIEYLDQAGLIALAESLTYTVADTEDNPFPLSIIEAEKLSEITLLTPDEAKFADYKFMGASYNLENKTVSLSYTDAEGMGFLVNQQPLGSPEDVYPLQGIVGASAPVEIIVIGGQAGEYVEGVWELTDNGPVWRSDPTLKTLRWKTDKLFIEIVYMGFRIEKADLIAFAESLK